MTRDRTIPERAVTALREFLELEAASGILLVGAAVLGMIAVNSPLSDSTSASSPCPWG